MAYQRGSLVKLHRKTGDIWVLRYRENRDDGERVQNDLPVGPVRHFPKEKDAWREVDRLGLLLRINAQHLDSRIRFRALAEHYLTHDVGPDALRPKSERTARNTNQIVRTYLLPQWGDSIADDIKPLDVQHWLKTLHTDKGLAWTTVSKFRGIMLRIYRIGALALSQHSPELNQSLPSDFLTNHSIQLERKWNARKLEFASRTQVLQPVQNIYDLCRTKLV